MPCTGLVAPTILSLLACGSAGRTDISLWREPLDFGLEVASPGSGPAESTTSNPERRLLAELTPEIRDDGAAADVWGPPDRAAELANRAAALPRVPTVVEQGGVDIQYCPEYLPELYPERNLAQHCGNSLLHSPFLDQGPDGTQFFRVAFAEVEAMDAKERDLVGKSLIAGAYYWQHRDSPDALDGALRTFLSEEEAGLTNVLANLGVPSVFDALPSEISGLPPAPEFGQAIDLRVASRATYKSVGDVRLMLRTAAERGLNGVAVTDLDHVEGFREVRNAADELKREGALPRDFVVIQGEEIQTLSGPLIGLFIEDRVPRGMTMRAAIDDIHRQGGVAVLADPGTGSGAKLVRTMPLDGYLLRTRPASVFRTLELMDDVSLSGKPLLGGSAARARAMVGLPYSAVETPHRSHQAVRRALRGHAAFGVASIQMPIVSALVFRPLVPYEKTISLWFRARDRFEMNIARLIGSDNVEIRTTYDQDMTSLLGLVQAPRVMGDVVEGTSSLGRSPDLLRISADYSHVRVEWNRAKRTVMVKGAIRW